MSIRCTSPVNDGICRGIGGGVSSGVGSEAGSGDGGIFVLVVGVEVHIRSDIKDVKGGASEGVGVSVC